MSLIGLGMNLFLAALIKPETLRSLWGAVGLIPAPRGIYPGTRPNDPAPVTMGEGEYDHPAVNFDLYDADAWKLGLSPEEIALRVGHLSLAQVDAALAYLKLSGFRNDSLPGALTGWR